MTKTELEKIIAPIKQAMNEECSWEPGSYAHSWHCTIASMCYEAIKEEANSNPHMQLNHITALKIANETASRIMKFCFDVETCDE